MQWANLLGVEYIYSNLNLMGLVGQVIIGSNPDST